MLGGGVFNGDIKQLRERAEYLLEAERLFFSQKSKAKFLKFGDRCSKFFHDLIKRNFKRNLIVSLKKMDGTTTSNTDEIAGEFVTYYKTLLGTEVNRVRPIDRELVKWAVIPHEFRANLVAQVTIDEIKCALFDIDDDKAPGQLDLVLCSSKNRGV